MRPEDKFDDRLRTLLQEGDPAADRSELSQDESANLRRAMLRSIHTPRPVRWLPIGVAAAAAMLAAVLLLPHKASTPTPSSTGTSPEAAEESTADAARQIRFATEQGTQIIWVLDPNLDL